MNMLQPIARSRISSSQTHAGLTSAEAKRQLDKYGPNTIPEDASRSVFAIAREILTEPMLLLLVVAAALYLLIGDLAEGLLLAGFAVLTIGLIFYQQQRSENALAALRMLGAPTARVFRDGKECTIAANEVVTGDLMLLDEGERVPADGMLISNSGLVVDESLLTGESVPVRKRAGDGGQLAGVPGGDDQPFVYSGTLVVKGHGAATVLDTGSRTRAGRIGVSLASIVVERTRLQISVNRIVRLFGGLAAIVCCALVVFYGVYREDWLQGVLSGIALAMGMLPEEFPVVLTIFLAIGAWRLARIKVLARRPAVIETLGAATVLCVDKTGTLTENRMRVRHLDILTDQLEVEPDLGDLPYAFQPLVNAAWLATRHASIDPMDRAVAGLVSRAGEYPRMDWPMVREYGLKPELLAMSLAWKDDAGHFAVACKGAPEAITDLCHLTDEKAARIMEHVQAMAEKGLRVLGVGIGTTTRVDLPESQHDFDFTFAGLVGFEDPLRTTVPAAVSEAFRAGISVKMITGDYPATALAIASAAGVDTRDGAVTGDELERADDAEMKRLVSCSNVFARIMPEQKLRIVEALKHQGEIVAMTGDGVNDAPALKAAHIGIAMGQRGTDVAREAAGIVLLDEDFGRIVSAVKMGRRIFDNLRKVMIYIAAIHVPIAGLALVPLIAGMPPLFFPAHVVVIEMIIDPMCSIVFERTPAERDIMVRPPRSVEDPLAGIPQIVFGLLQGSVLLVVCLALYHGLLLQDASVETARTAAFIAVTAGNLSLALVNSSREAVIVHTFERGRMTFWIAAAIAVSVVSICIVQPNLAELFGFTRPEIGQAALAAGAGVVAVLPFDVVKFLPGVRRIIG
ncbi:cation-translocating P-type ATPase [Phyllobacterium bourgognense]|uniref:Ca2+-transporting ATPase n=1 Tax=Phyllobacterium bourgognense TaxID=314236 RepID=A0A368YT19_9HYPH|nr:cation-translocating P-type ATPase [Phyllobacterium bourgognense]RCW81314.1 Ca2+-transporting ATPase [Phyllobacterium bourgognense]